MCTCVNYFDIDSKTLVFFIQNCCRFKII